MKTAIIPLGAGTIGVGLGLAVAAWRGDLGAQEAAAAHPPPSLTARSGAQPSLPGGGLSWVADARSLRPAPARAATAAAQPVALAQPPVSRSNEPAATDVNVVDAGAPDATSPAIGEPDDPDSSLAARDRAAAHSARSH